jgi:2-dehydro-3-deoxy-D-arabinonate dehydratase
MLVRYEDAGTVQVGRLTDRGVIPVAATMHELLALPVEEMRERAAGTGDPRRPARLLPPVDGRTEVWAAGVTYRRSRSARVEESVIASVYDLVYDAERPELFFKAPAWRVVGDGEPVAVRKDSAVNVPEPELAIVLNAAGAIVGYSICDDVSSRSIEGENPLYLPQAKVYARSCALGPGITPAWEVPDPTRLGIAMTISRAGAPVWAGTASVGQMKRGLDELAGYLFRELDFPHGAVLSTGTGIVPGMDFTLAPGDTVAITIEGLGTLTNPVL